MEGSQNGIDGGGGGGHCGRKRSSSSSSSTHIAVKGLQSVERQQSVQCLL